mmetsp:Transcript_14127/g.60476  ORF Transcript_14127/g.60476 Transcript_14127/m.60476 type:complete len:275 (-) Transcript_14127:607-1431(-)
MAFKRRSFDALKLQRAYQLPVHGEVGVPPDRRREVRVQRRGEAVVRQRSLAVRSRVAPPSPFRRAGDAIHRLAHASRGDDAQQRVEVRVVGSRGGVQRIREGFAGCYVHLHASRRAALEQRIEHARRGRGVPAEHRLRRERLEDRLGARDVREKHHLLHHPVRLARHVHAHVQRIGSALVQLELHLGRRQAQSARGDSSFAKRLGAKVDVPQILRQIAYIVRVVHHRLRLLVRQRRVTSDDRLREPRLCVRNGQTSGGVELEKHRKRQAFGASS